MWFFFHFIFNVGCYLVFYSWYSVVKSHLAHEAKEIIYIDLNDLSVLALAAEIDRYVLRGLNSGPQKYTGPDQGLITLPAGVIIEVRIGV